MDLFFNRRSTLSKWSWVLSFNFVSPVLLWSFLELWYIVSIITVPVTVEESHKIYFLEKFWSALYLVLLCSIHTISFVLIVKIIKVMNKFSHLQHSSQTFRQGAGKLFFYMKRHIRTIMTPWFTPLIGSSNSRRSPLSNSSPRLGSAVNHIELIHSQRDSTDFDQSDHYNRKSCVCFRANSVILGPVLFCFVGDRLDWNDFNNQKCSTDSTCHD